MTTLLVQLPSVLPDHLADLKLDQALASMIVGRQQHGREQSFYAPTHDVSAVRYRHEVIQNLQDPLIRSYGEDSYRSIFGVEADFALED